MNYNIVPRNVYLIKIRINPKKYKRDPFIFPI